MSENKALRWVKCINRMPLVGGNYALRHISGELEIGHFDRNNLMYGNNWLSIRKEEFEWLEEDTLNPADMPFKPVDKTVDEMATAAREGKDLHYGGYREVAQTFQSQLSSMFAELARTKKDFDVMVGNDTRQEAAIEKLIGERDAALKCLNDQNLKILKHIETRQDLQESLAAALKEVGDYKLLLKVYLGIVKPLRIRWTEDGRDGDLLKSETEAFENKAIELLNKYKKEEQK